MAIMAIMATVGELLDGLRDALNGDDLVSAAVSAAITPAGRTLLAGFVTGLADLEARHEADKQAAVQAAHDQGVAEGQSSVPS